MIHCVALLITLLWHASSFGLSVRTQPICTVKTIDSILENPEPYKPVQVGNRERRATCTGAGWFHGNHLVTANLYGSKLLNYQFNQETKEFVLVQQISQHDVPLFNHLEALSVSADQAMLAVISNAPGTSHLFIFNIDQTTHLIDPHPILTFKTRGFLHNVRFSPDNEFIAIASFINERAMALYKINKNQNNYDLSLVYTHANNHPLLVAKGVNFTSDGHFAFIAYALTTTSSTKYPFQSCLDVFEFDAQSGRVGQEICSIPGTFSFEDLTLLDQERIIALPDQAHDKLIFYHFDPATGLINPEYFAIGNPDAQLSFPHGVAASPDGKYLIATNYGTDTFNLYQLDEGA